MADHLLLEDGSLLLLEDGSPLLLESSPALAPRGISRRRAFLLLLLAQPPTPPGPVGPRKGPARFASGVLPRPGPDPAYSSLLGA